MKDHTTKILDTLEFPKIVSRLASHTATSLGRQQAEQLTPSADLEEVKRRLQATDEAATVMRLKGQAPFGGVRDVGSAVRRSQISGTLRAEDLLHIADTVSGGRKLKVFLLQFHKNHPIPILQGLADQIAELAATEREIRDCIDENGEVTDQASAELGRIRKELRNSESRARDKLEQMLRTSSVQKMLQEQLITVRNDRYVIPVKQEYRAHFGGLLHDQSASGATLFIEPEAVVQINNKLRELKLKEEKEIERILRMLTAQVAEVSEELKVNLDMLAQLDFMFAKAGLAYEWKSTLPIMNDRGFIKLKKGRHPLIPGDAVPIDVELGNRYSAIIITGPNTGGKTVTLKTIGLLNLMAMSGLFIPAEDGSQMCVFDAIYADIGDEQSIEQSLSTFSSHMTNIVGILKEMTPKSLILLDELGAGTDPAEGSALAIAILEHVHERGSRIVATTHFSELKAYAYDRKGFINASMEFDVQTLSPTYRLLLGVPGRSNAFAIAERLGLMPEVIEHARGQVNEEDQRVESMIASLEQNRLEAEADKQTAAQLRLESEKLRERLNEQQRKAEQQREQLMRKAEQEAREAVAKARREADEIIADLRRMAMEEGASVKEHKLIEAKSRLNRAAPDVRVDASDRPVRRTAGAEAKPGDQVLVRSLGQKGIVVEEAGKSEFVIQLGALKTKLKKSDVEKLESPAPSPSSSAAVRPQATLSLKRTREENVRTELDLRGNDLEEAITQVDRFLDEAFLSNLGQVYIIHGKGTGTLRSGIHQYLRRHRNIKSYRLGEYGEGGTGVTVVEFKA